MKNSHLFLISIVVIAIISCKKTYTCDCETNTVISFMGSGDSIYTKSKTVPYSEKMTENQAKSACDHEAAAIKTTEENFINSLFPPGFGIFTQVSTTAQILSRLV